MGMPGMGMPGVYMPYKKSFSYINAVQLTGIYVATIIGAGFASGREISLFFAEYEKYGIVGIVLSMCLLGLISFWAISMGANTGRTKLGEALGTKVGKVYGTVAEILIGSFTFCVFAVMVAGMAETMSIMTGLSRFHMLIISSLLCCLILLGDLKGIVTFNTVVTPLLFLGIGGACIFVLIVHPHGIALPAVKILSIDIENIASEIDIILKNSGWFISSAAYASYNALPLASVLCEASTLAGTDKKNKTAIVAVVASSLILCVLAIMLYTVLMRVPGAKDMPMPLHHALSSSVKQNNSAPILSLVIKGYMVILLAAMLSSALSAGYCMSTRLSGLFCKFIKIKPQNIRILSDFLLCAIIIPVAGAGFMNLVTISYPLFGALGLLYFLILGFRHAKISKSNINCIAKT